MRRWCVPTLLALFALGCGDQPPEGLEGLTVPDGFTVEIAAAPPLVERPMIVSADDQGRLYVAESSGSNDPVEKQLEERPHSILRLVDEDGDGVYDSRTVFADGLMLPEGVLWHDGSVYVAAPPTIWRLTDTDDDGVADQREAWYDPGTLTGCANDLHGPYLGLDGWIYWAKGAFAEQTHTLDAGSELTTRAAHILRRRPEGGPVDVVLTGGMDNPVEVAFLPEGERFITSTFLQHPELGRRDGLIHALYGGVYGKIHNVIDDHPQTGGPLDAMTHLGPAAPVGLAAYRSRVFGDSYRRNLFATLFNMHKVTRHVLEPAGATFRTEDSDFLVSESSDFHPTDVMEDADGSLLVVDTGAWYKLCCPTSQLAKPDVLGAIYRVRKTDSPELEDPRGLELDWESPTPAELASRLADERPAVRDRAVRETAKLGDAAVEALAAMVNDELPEAGAAAVWALTRIDSPAARAAVGDALSGRDPLVRQAAAHSVGLWRDAAASEPLQLLLQTDPEPIQRAAAEALGRIGDAAAIPAIFTAVEFSKSDALTHSLTYALIEIGDPEPLRSKLLSPTPPVRRAALIALGEMDGSRLRSSDVVPLLSSGDSTVQKAAVWTAGRHPEWGGELAGYFESRLGAGGAALESLVARFAEAPAVRELLARTVVSSNNPKARMTALRIMARAALKETPESWTGAIEAALASPLADEWLEAVKTARKLPEDGRRRLRPALLRFAGNGDASHAARTEALAAAAHEDAELDPALFDFGLARLDQAEPSPVRGAAAAALTGFRLNDDQRLALAEALRTAGALELPRLLGAFESGGGRQLGERLIAALSEARVPGAVRPAQLEAVLAGFPTAVREQAAELIKSVDEDRDAQRKRLEEVLASLGEGDVRRGQAVFNGEKAACKSCHAMGYEGGRVGPDLTRIGQIRERKDLLEAVLYPSASFVRSYEPLVIQTYGGEIHNGVSIEETDEQIVLAVAADEEVRIEKAAIEEVRPGTVSVMPSGLENELSEQELADLIAFLEATRWGAR